MDKYEYRVKSDEIRTLISNGEYVEAAKIADEIDWRRVKSVMMLCTISDLYKINRRFEDSKELLLLAYERHPEGRTIVYSLCELSIKMGEFVQAIEYYKEFVQIAPKDSGRYILQYKLYVAQDVSLEERIEVLEEMKKRDYREKWAYELAYLYHRIGLGTKCVEECDELILWFGEGKYVTKAMELKMLHAPLSEAQQEKFTGATKVIPTAQIREAESESVDIEHAHTVEISAEELEDIQVKTMDVGQYNTINLQKELAESMKELLMDSEVPTKPQVITEEYFTEPATPEEPVAPEESVVTEEPDEDEEFEEHTVGSFTENILAPLLQNTDDMTEIALQMDDLQASDAKIKEVIEPVVAEEEEEDTTANKVMEEMKKETLLEPTEIPGEFQKILGMEYDGQISLIVPESENLEKQITGQISIEDILSEWEKMKKENEEKRAKEVRQRVLEHTGNILIDFDAAAKSGLLEQLEIANGIDPETVISETVIPETEDIDEEFEEIEEIGEIEETEETPEELDKVEEPEEIEEPEELEEVEELQEQEEVEELEEVEEPEELDEVEELEEVEETSYGRKLTEEEKMVYGPFIQDKKTKQQLVNALDSISLAAYVGNLIITGEEGMDTLTLAKNMIREVQQSDSNFFGKIAKINGASLNKRDIKQTMEKIANGALIIENAGTLSGETLEKMHKAMEQEHSGLIIVLEGTKKTINKLVEEHSAWMASYTARVDVQALSDDALVAFGKKYAKENEYSIDELGMLALHTRVADRQTSDHSVTTDEVKAIVDQAIHHANKKNIPHFFDILLAKRYDEEDMIILREKDFN